MYLVDLLVREKFDLLIYHGLAQGGGEKVAHTLKKIFNCTCISHALSMREIFKYVNADINNSILYTSGPRDLPMLIFSFFLRKKVAVYIQVPYLSSISVRKPLYTIIVFLYYCLINLFQFKVYVNSSNSGLGFSKYQILLPLKNKARNIKSIKITKRPTIYIVGRYNLEFGRSSRNINRICQILEKLSSIIDGCIEMRHYGSICQQYEGQLMKIDKVNFHSFGYVSDWSTKAKGIFLFNSNYEGFGLAAYEAAIGGNLVLVNDKFPVELKKEVESIYFYRSIKDCVSKLSEYYAM